MFIVLFVKFVFIKNITALWDTTLFLRSVLPPFTGRRLKSSVEIRPLHSSLTYPIPGSFFALSPYLSTLKMEAAPLSEALVPTY
jgi:hypothetical protein